MARNGPMRKAVFISKRMLFDKNNAAFKDMLMGYMAMDIEIFAKNRVPVKHGLLSASIRHFRGSKGLYRVEANKEYAAYQEAGMAKDGTRIVKNYTTPGTGPHWFQGAIDKVWQDKESYVSKVTKALKL